MTAAEVDHIQSRKVLYKRPHPAQWPRAVPAFVYRAFKLSDLSSAVLALSAALIILNLDDLPHGVAAFLAIRITVDKVLLLGVFALFWNRAFQWLSLYNRSRKGAEREELSRIAAACSLGALPALLFPLFSASGSFSFQAVPLFWALSIPVVAVARLTIRVLGTSFPPRDRMDVLIVGSGPRAQRLCRRLCGRDEVDSRSGCIECPRPVCAAIGFVDEVRSGKANPLFRPPWLGSLSNLNDVLMHRVVDEVLIALPIKSCYQQIQEVIHTCERLGVRSTYLADIFEPSLGRVAYERPMFRTVKVVQDDFRLVIKRAIDVVGAALGLVALVPLFMVIASLVKLTSPGPIIFSQLRYGLNKRLFRMHKFRTMVPDAEAQQSTLEPQNEARGPVFKIAGDPRVTSLGRLLRKTSLDELPQLWNILKGDMSLVGPRPLPTRDVGKFAEGWLMRRFSMAPGLTCLWQVSGRNNVGFEQWVQLDLEYIDTWSLRLDARILLKTIPAVLTGKGAV